jgi:tRNA dimethylallyltransferase
LRIRDFLWKTAIFAPIADMTASSDLLVIIGATASGKSALAMKIAEQTKAEILSVDSMQIYRGMDVGTAKPTCEEQARVRHHLIDVADANQTFAVSKFVELADAIISDAKARKVRLIATGGTPMYYKALFEGLFAGPGADANVRASLGGNTNEQLHARLSEVDPETASRIHLNDRKRLILALEVFELTGKPISSMQNEWQGGMQRHRAVWFGLAWEKEALNRRINARVKQMIADGWAEETRSLLDRFGELSKTASEATGYHELIEHVRGKISLEDAIEQIKIATRQLARRQMKWFRRVPNETWLKGDAPLEQNVERVLRGTNQGIT